MPLAKDVASELRKLADALDREPNAQIEPFLIQSPHSGRDEKAAFLSLVRLLPRPLTKGGDADRLVIRWGQPFKTPVSVRVSIPRSYLCRLVKPAQPAEYECDPILSQIEEESLAAQGDGR